MGTNSDQSKKIGQPQFTLNTLCLAIIAIGLLIWPVAQFGITGAYLSIFIAVVGLIVAYFRWRGVVFVSLGSTLLASFTLTAGSAVRMAALRSHCSGNVRQLAMAIHEYEFDHGHLPPRYSTDASGIPLHSWRVLILPYLGYQALYDEIELEKPWNDPVNLKLANKMPEVFHCPSDDNPFTDTMTTYVALYGQGTVWDEGGKLNLTNVSQADGTATTLLLIESIGARTQWMSPFDLHIDQLSVSNPTNGSYYWRSDHPLGINTACCDTSIHFVPVDAKPDLIRAHASWNGNDEGEGMFDFR